MFFVALLVDGVLAGAVYALIGLALVVVYKTSRVINFALGEWTMFAARLTGVGLHGAGLGLVGAVGLACAGMVAVALGFNRLAARSLTQGRAVSMIMLTLGLGAVLRAAAALGFRDVPARIPLPIPADPLNVHGIVVATDKLVASGLAIACVVAVAWFFARSRRGVALRAIADDPQAAMSVGIDLHRHFAITWAMAGMLCVVAGVLWTAITGGGFSVVLLGLKVFPIVIIGGLDSVPGTIAGALLVGVLESVGGGYLDPLLGGGFGTVLSYLVLLAVLVVRPHGLGGQPTIARV